MLKYVLSASLAFTTPAAADIWATGDCVAANGQKIRYVLNDGKGLISYDGKGPYDMFSKRSSENMGVITHIGNHGNTVLAVDLETGRGYIITKFDDGRQVEYNVSCRLGSMPK
jgi:hypothetical protein